MSLNKFCITIALSILLTHVEPICAQVNGSEFYFNDKLSVNELMTDKGEL